jgi:hypothetical protein
MMQIEICPKGTAVTAGHLVAGTTYNPENHTAGIGILAGCHSVTDFSAAAHTSTAGPRDQDADNSAAHIHAPGIFGTHAHADDFFSVHSQIAGISAAHTATCSADTAAGAESLAVDAADADAKSLGAGTPVATAAAAEDDVVYEDATGTRIDWLGVAQ